MPPKITVSRAVWDEREEALRRLARLSEGASSWREYARRIEDHFVALGAVVGPDEEDRARKTIAAERACFDLSPPPNSLPVHSTDADGFVKDWAKLDQVSKPITARITRTMTIARPATMPEKGATIRIVEPLEGRETHTYWRVIEVTDAEGGQVAIDAEFIGGGP